MEPEIIRTLWELICLIVKYLISPGAEPLILNLSSNIYSSDITQQIEVMRWNFFEESGIPLPKIIVNPVKNNDSAIEFLLYQESIYKDTLTDDTVYFEAGHAEISFEFVPGKAFG